MRTVRTLASRLLDGLRLSLFPFRPQIVLYLGTSEFELVYKDISTTTQGGAVYGVALGPGSHRNLMSPKDSVKCTGQLRSSAVSVQ